MGVSDVNLGDAVLELGRIFRYYRITKMTIRLPPPLWSTAAAIVAGYYPAGNTPTVPAFSTFEAEHMVIQTANDSVGRTLVVPSRAMNPQHEWFLTTGDASEPNADIMGYLLFASSVSSNETLTFQLSLDYEFCELMDPSIIGPAIRS